MSPDIVPAYHVPVAEQAEIFTRAFAGYVGGSFAMDPAGMSRFILLQGADLCYSRFARTTDGLVGFAYVNRTGEISRLAGMGVLPNARRAGFARQLVHHLIDEAKTRHDRAIMLEVIEQNPAGHALYRSTGFQQTARLLGWRRPAPKAVRERADPLEEITVLEATQLPSAHDYPELPWAISRHAIAKMSGGRAFRQENSIVVISDPEVSPVRIHALSCASDVIDWTALRMALSAILAFYSDREFFTPPVFPEQFGKEIFQPLGFTAEPISQFLMGYDLSERT